MTLLISDNVVFCGSCLLLQQKHLKCKKVVAYHTIKLANFSDMVDRSTNKINGIVFNEHFLLIYWKHWLRRAKNLNLI